MTKLSIQSILFVCTGNICRSPMAEAVFRHQATLIGRDIRCDSAGTHGYHIGERPDPRTLKICKNYGISSAGLVARQVGAADFGDFDLILAMDEGHYRLLLARCPPAYISKIQMFSDTDVPDPYYGDFSDFELVYQMVSQRCQELLQI